jgi:hypothetical protein
MGPSGKSLARNRLIGGRLLLLALALPGGLFAQQFAHIDPLYFTRPFGGVDPLPQVVELASTGAVIGGITVTASTSSGGNWLSASPTGYCCATPDGISAIVDTSTTGGAAMAAGTYMGQVVFSASGITTLTVSVTLVIAPVTATFFDNTPGQASFSMNLNGQPPPQVLQIRNAGAGTLNWTLTTSTFNGANWLSVSATSGTAPSVITVSILPANLPSAGATAGTYGGQLLFQTAGGASIVSVPVGVTVSPNAMAQVNALSFTKPFGGSNPLPQTVTLASLGTVIGAITVGSATASGSTGGTWLTVSPTGYCCATPEAITISPTPAVTLAAGSYTGQVTVDTGTQLMVIPVTLTIGAPSAAFFDNIAGQLSFFLQTAAPHVPPSQLLQIRNAGGGTLNWTLTPTTFNSGSWLTVSEMSDTAPSQISIGIVPANLPNGGLTAGVYIANLLFQGGGTSVTVPITVQVGAGFEQVNGINFTKVQNGANPLPQNITLASTGAVIGGLTVDYDTATGGNWLSVSPSGYCCATPETLEVSVNAAVTLAAGTYTAEIVVYSSTTSMTVPVTLTVASPANPYFDNLPGEMTFSMKTGAPQPPATQIFQIRNAGGGTLNWSLTAVTYDGGNWLTVSAPNGTAPELVTVGIVPGNLPNGGLVAGVFVGQLLLQAGGSSVTIPVSVDVGTAVFGQLNGLNFTMPQAGANPLPQVITMTSTGAVIGGVTVTASTATGGAWLTVSPSGYCCSTPEDLTVTVNAAPTMAAGIYTGQISFYTSTVSQTVPVTLTVGPPNTPFFDNVPGALSYSLVTDAGNPPPQNVQIRNAGTGTLSWTSQAFTFDGGNWLTVSAASGTAPSLVSIGIVTANLPNAGLVAGLFTGQVLFLSGNSNSVTVPVSVVVGGNGFAQINGINFTMPLTGANPLPQILTTTSIGAAIGGVTVSAATGNGGSWLTVSPSGYCCSTPEVFMVTVTAPSTLAAGTYTGEVIFDATRSAMVVPVTLTVAPSTVPFFDNVQGQMSFFAATGATPASLSMLIEGLGAYGLNWTLTPMTADNGNWLTISATTGTAPSSVTVGIDIANLPNQGLVAGQFTGQLLYQSGSSSVTVPVSVQLGPNTFAQMAGLSFSMPYGGSNPLSQTATVSSRGTAIGGITASADSGNGGKWLSITPSGYCCSTGQVFTFSVNGSPSGTPVPPGIHTGQAVFDATTSAITVPVILNVQGTPILSIAKSHTGNFRAGQTNATYTVTVSNKAQSGVGTTNGTVTVTETVPNGMTLVSMAGGDNVWSCSGNTCTRSDGLGPGQSYPPITVTVDVVTTSQESLTNQVSVSGGGSVTANASDTTAIITRCNVNGNGSVGLPDIETMIEEALGLAPPLNDLNGDGVVNLVDVQIVVDAALGLGCLAR